MILHSSSIQEAAPQLRPTQGAPSPMLDATAAALGFEEYEQGRVQRTKIAVITGGSSGIGQEIARELVDHGLHVFVASRYPERGALKHERLERLRMDVTDEASVQSGIDTVLRETGRLDVLINNAGYALLGPIEEVSVEEARTQFETNFFGALRVTRSALPLMRHQRQGRIVNISSVVGFVPAPYMGVYAASKYALEGYTETLDHEVREFGIRAVLVEPYFTKTSLADNGRVASRTLDAYREQRARTTAAIERSVARGENPQAVAQAVWRAVSAKNPRLRYPVGHSALLSKLRRFVPAGLFERRLRKQFELEH